MPVISKIYIFALTVILGFFVNTESFAEETVVRIGYFPNVTHAQALVGMVKGVFQEHLGPNVKIEVKIFNAGPSVIEALFAGH